MVKNIIAAFQFLTILPLPVNTSQKNLEKSIVWFPIVGTVIGLITGYGNYALGSIFPVSVSSALTLVLYIVLTRGLHLDGFMDTIDGFFSHRSKKDDDTILTIMKDPVVGSFAVLGAIVWALILYSAIPYLTPLDYILIHMLPRLVILPLALLFSYPRQSGTGKFFADNVTVMTVVIAVLLSVVILVSLLFIREDGSFRLALKWIALMVVAFIVALGIGKWSKKKINGITGDVLGFIIEVLHGVLVLLISLPILQGEVIG